MSAEDRMSVLYVLIALAVFAAGFGAALFGLKTHTIVRTHVVKVEKSYGHLDQTVDGAAINPQLAGLRCDIYGAAKTIVCHP